MAKTNLLSTVENELNPFLKEAQSLVDKANSIKVTDVSQMDLMSEAKEIRKKLRDIRMATEERRKFLKTDVLDAGRTIDGMAKKIFDIIIPLEKYLEVQEKYAENIEIKRLEDLETIRRNELSKYVSDLSIYNFKTMSDEVYTNVLNDAKQVYELKQEKIKTEQEEDTKRKKTEEYHRYKQNKILPLQEMALKFFPDDEVDWDSILNAEGEDFENRYKKAFDEITEKVNKIKEANLKNQEDLQQANQAKEKAEKELQEKKDAETRQKREDAKKRKQEALAPDKEKLRKLLSDILSITYPDLKEQEAVSILDEVKLKMKEATYYITNNLENI